MIDNQWLDLDANRKNRNNLSSIGFSSYIIVMEYIVLFKKERLYFSQQSVYTFFNWLLSIIICISGLSKFIVWEGNCTRIYNVFKKIWQFKYFALFVIIDRIAFFTKSFILI